MTVFRIHYVDGSTVDIEAESPRHARVIANERRSGIITKIKVLKDRKL